MALRRYHTFSGSLAMLTSPPIRFTSDLQMERPNPVPPKRRQVELSA